MFEIKKCKFHNKLNIKINSDLNIKYVKIVLLLGITAMILWISMHVGGWLYILPVAVLTTLMSILALEFYPFLRRFYLAMPILLNLLIGWIGFDQAMIIDITDGMELLTSILKYQLYFGIGNLIVSGVASKVYVKKRKRVI